MSFRRTKDFVAWKARRSQRGADLGTKLEERVDEILSSMQESSEIESFIQHSRNSPEDRSGRDFTVSKNINDLLVEKSFGVTVSYQSVAKSRNRHPEYKQFIFPVETKSETIKKRILDLFN